MRILHSASEGLWRWIFVQSLAPLLFFEVKSHPSQIAMHYFLLIFFVLVMAASASNDSFYIHSRNHNFPLSSFSGGQSLEKPPTETKVWSSTSGTISTIFVSYSITNESDQTRPTHMMDSVHAGTRLGMGGSDDDPPKSQSASNRPLLSLIRLSSWFLLGRYDTINTASNSMFFLFLCFNWSFKIIS